MSYGKIFSILKENNLSYWNAYTKHDFVSKLTNSTLNKKIFLNYLIQDYLFLIQFSKAWSLAIVKSDTLDEMKVAANTVNGLINFEMDLHIDLCGSYGISKIDLENANEENENIAYTRYVLEAGYSGDLLDLLAALIPCVLGYGEIGINNRNIKPEELMYQKWLETYSSKEYQQICKEVATMFDNAVSLRLGKNYNNNYKWNSIKKIFRKAVLLEIDFWNMAMRLDN
jgi:thiaminase/transcriptional activator TenA